MIPYQGIKETFPFKTLNSKVSQIFIKVNIHTAQNVTNWQMKKSLMENFFFCAVSGTFFLFFVLP